MIQYPHTGSGIPLLYRLREQRKGSTHENERSLKIILTFTNMIPFAFVLLFGASGVIHDYSGSANYECIGFETLQTGGLYSLEVR